MRLSSILAKSTPILPLINGPLVLVLCRFIGLEFGLALLLPTSWLLYCVSALTVPGLRRCTSGAYTAQVIGVDFVLALLTSHQWFLYCVSIVAVLGLLKCTSGACTAHIDSDLLASITST